MRYLRSLGAFVAAFAICLVSLSANRADDAKSIELFNGKNLDGWHSFIPHQDGTDPQMDPRGVFQVEDGVIHISGAEFGCLTTNDEFENYRLTLEFKWGGSHTPPPAKAANNSGVLLHCVGPEKVWPKSIECQVQEHNCGDFWLVSGATLHVNGKPVQDRAPKTSDHEKPLGEWNTIEVICDGSTIINKVNGIEVNRGTDSSVTRGKITLQSEGAEIVFRKVELTPLR